MNLKILHCADLHIGKKFSYLDASHSSERSKALRLSLTKITDFCKENGVDALLICGDLFDVPVPTKTDSDFVKKELAKISPIPVFIIAGNHDYLCPDSPFIREGYFSENVHIFGENESFFVLSEKNAVIWGKSYTSSSCMQSFSSCSFDNDKINIMCLHGDTVSGSDYNIIDSKTLSSLPCHYAAFGHEHSFEEFSFGNVKCAYCGTPEPHSFSDSGKCGFALVEIKEGEASITPIDMSQKKYIHLDIDITDKTEDYILKLIYEKINETDFFRIRLTGQYMENSAPDTSYIEKEVLKKAYFIDIIDESTVMYDFDSIEREESLRGEFLRCLRQSTQNEKDFISCAIIGLDALSGNIPDLGGIL